MSHALGYMRRARHVPGADAGAAAAVQARVGAGRHRKAQGDIHSRCTSDAVAVLDQLEKTELSPTCRFEEIVFVSGSQLGAELATRALGTSARSSSMYSSTEVAFATIAGPKDLQFSPSGGAVVRGDG